MRKATVERAKRPARRSRSEDEIGAALIALESGFAEDPAAVSGVAVALGAGAKVRVERGHLCVSDGEGWFRRERRWNRATGGLRRLIVGAHSGYLSIEAVRWCHEMSVAVLVLDDDGDVLLAPADHGVDDARLRRVQAAPPDGMDLEVARLLLRPKLLMQGAVLRDRLDEHEPGETLAGLADALDNAQTVDECRQLEASGAAAYFAAWIGHPATTLRFTGADARTVPQHFFAYDGRRSLLSKGVSARRAHQPVAALQNLNYKLAEIEAHLACIAVGLDSGIAFVHADIARRQSLGLDLLEPVRPLVDRFVLDIVAERTFTRADFIERGDGSIRIAPRLVQECAAAMPAWARAVAPHAEAVAHLLGSAVTGKWSPTTKLTNRNARAAQAEVKARKIATNYRNRTVASASAAARRRLENQSALFASCLRCGGPLARSRHLYCRRCQDETPGHARETRRRRGQAIAATRAELERWKIEHPEAFADPDAFRRDILPGLVGVKLSEIVRVCGISKTTASNIRAGKSVPAARHWPALRSLMTANGQDDTR
jgi:CRISPR-associated protein Cas1